MERTSATIGASWVREKLGFDGTGVGVAIIDSGIANWHDDLGADRVVHFADFVTFLPQPHDDYGHGTHVAGIIAGNGYDSGGARRGIAPGANLIVLKVLDATGDGFISNVIAAIDYAIEQRVRLNIRVLNLSVAAGVYESFTTDPFTLAAKRAVDAGIVVVTSAGNLGSSETGQVQYGGITAPGNAPWVLTVGASNHQRTAARADDVVAPFSSRGPTNIDRAMKPDVVAPGVAIESLAAAGSTIYTANPKARLVGHDRHRDAAVPRHDGDEHGGPGGCRHGRLDAAGEPRADAEPREGHPGVHRGASRPGGAGGAGRRVRKRSRRRAAGDGAPRGGSTNAPPRISTRRRGAATSSGAANACAVGSSPRPQVRGAPTCRGAPPARPMATVIRGARPVTRGRPGPGARRVTTI